jgi:hypothetical protein
LENDPDFLLQFLVSKRIGVRIRNDLPVLLRTGLSVRLVKRFPVVFEESIERRFRMFIDGADGRHEARIQKGFHAFAELVCGSFGGAGHVSLDGLASGIASSAALCVE